MNGKKWNQKEIELLKYLYEEQGLACKEISNIINRPYYGIRKQIVKIKLRHTFKQKYDAKSRATSGKNNGMFGKKSWAKGLTKETDERLKISSQKISKIKIQQSKDGTLLCFFGKNNGMFGKTPWNRGLTKSTNKKVKHASIKLSKIMKEKWEQLPENEKERRRKQWALQGLKCNKKETSIELKVKNFLEETNINFESQYNISRFIVDFYLKKYNLVIECLGDYWHGNPLIYKKEDLNITQKNNIIRDNRKKKLLEKRNINYIFLWERDINGDFKNESKKILERIEI